MGDWTKALGLVCPYCGKSFKGYEALMNHRVKHNK